MKVYSLYSILINESAYVDLVNDKNNIIKYFFQYGEGELNTKPVFKCQSGFSLQNIHDTDLYESTAGILVFSKEFHNKMGEILSAEMDFYEADLIVENKNMECIVGKITNIESILNMEKTVYDDWLVDEEDDEPFIDDPVFLNNIPDTIYCVKHSSRQRIEVFTEEFKRIADSYKLKLRFEEVKQEN